MKVKKLFLLYVVPTEGDDERYVAFITNKGVDRCKEKAEELWLDWTGVRINKEEYEENFDIIDIAEVEVEL